MRIVLDHVTRMNTGRRICIAGIEEQSERHVRPTTAPDEPLTGDLLAAEGGFVEPVRWSSSAHPHLNRRSPRSRITVARLLTSDSCAALARTSTSISWAAFAEDDLEAIFGHELVRLTDWKYGVEAGHGSASLGVLRVHKRSRLSIDRYGKVTMRLNDLVPPAFIRVTDVRFFESDQKTPRADVVEDVDRRLGRGEEAVQMVGLSRVLRLRC